MVEVEGGRRRIRGSWTVSAGFSLLELTIVIVIVAILAVILMARLLALHVEAERVAMETVAGTLRSAIGMTVAESLLRHELRGLQALEGSNPMDRLAELPTNYLGEFENPDLGSLEDGHWYFDKTAGELVYLVRNKQYFSGGDADPPRARFSIRLVYADKNSNGHYDDGIDSVQGLRLAAVEPYKWVR